VTFTPIGAARTREAADRDPDNAPSRAEEDVYRRVAPSRVQGCVEQLIADVLAELPDEGEDDHNRERHERRREPAADPLAQNLNESPSDETAANRVRERARLTRAGGKTRPVHPESDHEPKGDG
jgi:hypothetical protein